MTSVLEETPTLSLDQLKKHNIVVFKRNTHFDLFTISYFNLPGYWGVQAVSPASLEKQGTKEYKAHVFTPCKAFATYFFSNGTTWDKSTPIKHLAVATVKSVESYDTYSGGQVIGKGVTFHTKDSYKEFPSFVEWAATLPPATCRDIVNSLLSRKWRVYEIVRYLPQLPEEDIKRCCQADSWTFNNLAISQRTQNVCDYAVSVLREPLCYVPKWHRTHELIKVCLQKGIPVTDEIWESEYAEEYATLACDFDPSAVASLPVKFQTEERLWQALRSANPAVVTRVLEKFPASKYITAEMLDYLLHRPEAGGSMHEEWLSLAVRSMSGTDKMSSEIYVPLIEYCPSLLKIVPPEVQTVSMVVNAYRKDKNCIRDIGLPIIELLLKMQM